MQYRLPYGVLTGNTAYGRPTWLSYDRRQFGFQQPEAWRKAQGRHCLGTRKSYSQASQGPKTPSPPSIRFWESGLEVTTPTTQAGARPTSELQPLTASNRVPGATDLLLPLHLLRHEAPLLTSTGFPSLEPDHVHAMLVGAKPRARPSII